MAYKCLSLCRFREFTAGFCKNFVQRFQKFKMRFQGKAKNLDLFRMRKKFRVQVERNLPAFSHERFGIVEPVVQFEKLLGNIIVFVDGVAGGFRCLLSPGSVDPYNPKVVRASMGALFHVPLEIEVPLSQLAERYRRIACLDLQAVGLPLIGAGLGVAHGVFYPAFNAVAVATAGPNERGKVMALFQASFHVGFSGGAFALGVLAAARGYPAVAKRTAAAESEEDAARLWAVSEELTGVRYLSASSAKAA